ncbi:MAG: leucine-rich repeat protein, partial [Kiritimatiellae bacterium]|nr:leucine-rich repeat protein [Kiritimatiellia bacterium]
MKRNLIFSLFFVLAAAPALATWTVTSDLNAETLRVGDTFTATDGTWDLQFRRGSNAAYTCKNNSGAGGEVLDLTTFAEDMAAAGVTWNGNAITVYGLNNEGFMNVSGLKALKLPATVTTLSNQSLKGTGLEGDFVLPDSITTMGDAVFQYCTALTSVTMNENIKTIQNTFYGCSSLVEVKLASGTTTLSGSPFRACPALTTVYANEEDRAVGSVVLPATVTSLPANCFYDDTAIERIVAPGVTTIGERAFQNCSALEEVELPALQAFSSTYAFYGCSSLRSIRIPNCVKMGNGTFQGCSTLEEVLVSPSFTTLGTDCFRDCRSFTTLYTNDETKVVGHVQLPATCTSAIGNYTFYYTAIERIDAPGVPSITGQRAFEGCSSLVEAHLPALTSMAGTYAFNSCPLLTTVEVSPNLAGKIGDCNFCICYSLDTIYQSGNAPVVGLVDLPAGVTALGWGAFWQCRSIEHVVAPGVVSVDNRAFRACTILETVRFSPDLAELKNNNGSSSDCAINECPALVDFYPSAMPKTTKLYAGTFVSDYSLTNTLDFSGATLTDAPGGFFLNNCRNVPCVKLPASFPKLYDREFTGLKPGAEIHFAGGVPSWSGNYPLWQGNNGAGYRYKIFVDAETYPAWTTSAGTFTPLTEAMKAESDYPGIATLGYINYASNNQNNWLVQEPFYVDVTFYDEDGTTVLGVERTLLDSSPDWTGATPAKDSSAQFDYGFAGWSTDGSAVVDLSTISAGEPMSLTAVYSPSTRAHEITWTWFDGAEAQTETTSVLYGETPGHAAVERGPADGKTYTFLGWSADGATVLPSLPAVTGPATYSAVFDEKDAATTVTVRWLDDDGSTLLGTTWPDSGTAAVAPLTPEKESTVSTTYAFAGWSTDGTSVLADLTVSADTDFIAVYAPSVRRYTISFVNWDGAVLYSADYDYGTAAASITPPANATRPADAENTYVFASWSPAFADVTGDATYTAVYAATPKTYAATFVDWDGAVLLGPTDYAVGSPVAAPSDPAREGHTFAGWSPAVATMPAADTTYTAVYTVN